MNSLPEHLKHIAACTTASRPNASIDKPSNERSISQHRMRD